MPAGFLSDKPGRVHIPRPVPAAVDILFDSSKSAGVYFLDAERMEMIARPASVTGLGGERMNHPAASSEVSKSIFSPLSAADYNYAPRGGEFDPNRLK
jgi:hypothetical protein